MKHGWYSWQGQGGGGSGADATDSRTAAMCYRTVWEGASLTRLPTASRAAALMPVARRPHLVARRASRCATILSRRSTAMTLLLNGESTDGSGVGAS